MVSEALFDLRSALTPVPISLQPVEPASQGANGFYCTVYCIGCGGTGAWTAPHLVRRVWQLTRKWQQLHDEHPDEQSNRSIKLIFVDPDVVERKNVEARQNFLLCDVGYPKARVLATRYALAFEGVKIEAREECFTPNWVQQNYGTSILLDCTDNAAARLAINEALSANVGAKWPRVWWLSAGNGRFSGQVLLGNTSTVERLAGALRGPVCGRLPSPALVEPGLLIPKADEVGEVGGGNLSCEDLVLADVQSPTINPHMAVWVDYYLHGLLNGGLTLYGTYLSLEVGSARSLETSARAWGEKFEKEPAFFLDSYAEAEAEVADSEEEEDLDDGELLGENETEDQE